MRSVLFCPATNQRAMAKLASLPCDAVIIDLEDAVGVDQKDLARKGVLAGFEHGFGAKTAALRINGSDTPFYAKDIELAARTKPDAVVLPKAEDVAQLDDMAGRLDAPLWLMIETPLGVLKVADLAAHSRVQALILGPNDLRLALAAQDDPTRSALQTSMGAVILAARAYGKIALDGVYNDFRDLNGLAREAAQARLMGFHGKTLIHPSQIEPTNTAFSPSLADVANARRIIEAFEAGDGNALQLDGVMIEALHVDEALRLLRLVDD
ncbi:MAG: CoA ester lyase [Pseudomonadota bacterium]